MGLLNLIAALRLPPTQLTNLLNAAFFTKFSDPTLGMALTIALSKYTCLASDISRYNSCCRQSLWQWWHALPRICTVRNYKRVESHTGLPTPDAPPYHKSEGCVASAIRSYHALGQSMSRSFCMQDQLPAGVQPRCTILLTLQSTTIQPCQWYVFA